MAFDFPDSKYIPSIVADLKEPNTIPISPDNPINNDVASIWLCFLAPV
jgi:hypothetical protein